MPETRRRLTDEAQRVNPVHAAHIWRAPAGAAVDVVIATHLDVYSAIYDHSVGALPNETGGFLIGRVAHDAHGDQCWLVEVEEAIPVEPIVQNPTHFQFTWRDVDRVRSYREGVGKALVGWYHTHPDLGVFLSETDLERTHRVLFSEPFQIALVYDPVRAVAGYFFWEGHQRIDASPASWREFAIAVAAPAAGPVTASGRRLVEEAGAVPPPASGGAGAPDTPSAPSRGDRGAAAPSPSAEDAS